MEETTSDAGAGPDDAIEVVVDPELEDLVPLFLENRRKDIGRLRDAVKAEDWGAVEDLGHGMKGIGGAYGFPPVSEIGGELERLGRDSEVDVGAVVAEVDRLERYLGRVRVRVGEE